MKACTGALPPDALDLDRHLCVLLIDAQLDRAGELEFALESAGCSIVHRVRGLSQHTDAHASASHVQPDLIVVDVDLPSSALFEDLRRITDAWPTVMFVAKSDSESIRSAVSAGIAAYVVKEAHLHQVRPVLAEALARFHALRSLKSELEKTRSHLADRKVVERAKGIVMARRRMNEDEAYRWLRSAAMNRGMRLVDVAHKVIDMAGLL